ncbi:MAG: sugar phosphate isomerase/epimerase [Thermoguttaceae bacterium]|nr:sugar phosphate isomerase/epimerase [Thermoguttaceae bacterium]
MACERKRKNGGSLSRREFLGGAVGLSNAACVAGLLIEDERAKGQTLATAGLSSPRQAATEQFRLRYMVASTLFGTMPLEVVASHAAATGAEAIDLWPRPYGNHREQVDEIGVAVARRVVEKHGVRIAAISRYDLGPFRLTEEMTVLKDLGGEVLITGCGRPKPPEPRDLKPAVEELVRALQAVAKEAEAKGLKVAIENHSSTLLLNADAVRWFAELNRYPSIGIALAPYHLPQDPQVLAALIKEVGQQIFVFYAWQFGKGCMQPMPKEAELEQLPGRGPLDFRPIMAALRQINFAGWTEIFMHSYPRGTPLWEEPSAIVNELLRAKRYLEKCLSASSDA